ncbi:MAG: hypothetical protein IE910_00670 [Brevundimonas sp.]|nr:hypothetical protein [Brevundimonas sp.]
MSKVAKWIFPAAGGKDGIIGTAKAVVGIMTGNWGMIASGVAQVAGMGKKAQGQARQASVLQLTLGETPREAIFGQTCTGGSLVDVFNFGGQYKTDKVTRCVALADHAIDGIVGFYIDETYYPWVGEGLQAAFSNKLSFHFRNASPTGHAPPQHVMENGGWVATDRMVGITHMWIDWYVDEKVWPQGHPAIRFVLRGLRAYDPRFDPQFGYSGPNPQTWEDRSSHRFTRNAKVLRYAYTRGIYAEGHHGDPNYLLIGRGLTAEEAPPAAVIADANLCDEIVDGVPRYTVGGVISAAQPFIDVDGMFAAAMAGVIVQREGTVDVEAGQAKAVVVTITDDDLVGGEPVSFSRFLPDNDGGRINTVMGRYIEPALGFKDHSAPVRRSLEDIQADGGPREQTVSLPLVDEVKQADRIIEIQRMLGRLERRASIVLPPKFAGLEEGDWIAWQSQRRHGGATVRYRIETYRQPETWRMYLTLREIASSVFGVPDPIEDHVIPPPAPIPLDALSLLDVTAEAITLPGETSTLPAIRFRWTAPVDVAVLAIRAEVRRVGETEAAPTRTEDVNTGELVTTNGVGADLALEVRLVPIGHPSRPVVPTTWATVATTPLIAGDTTHVGGRPVGQVVQSLDEVLLDVQALEIEAGEIQTSQSQLRAVMQGQGSLLSNPSFWGAGRVNDFPEGWGDWIGASIGYTVVGGQVSDKAIRFEVPAETDLGHRAFVTMPEPAGGSYVLELIVTLEGGALEGAGMYVETFNALGKSGDAMISAGLDADLAGQVRGSGEAGRTYIYAKLVEFSPATQLVIVYMMPAWGGLHGQLRPAKTVVFHHVSVRKATAEEVAAGKALGLDPTALSARNASHDGALADVNGKLQAWSQKRVIAGQAQAFAQMMALDDNGVPTSSVRFGAGEVGLWNQIGGEDQWVEVLTLQGGNGRFSGNLSVASGIYLGNGTVWSVALRPQTFVLGDGETISFGGANIGIPTYEFMRDNLLPLAAGESYDLQIKNLTAAGGTVWAKISIPGTPAAQSLAGPGTAPGSGPTRQNVKTPKPDAANGNYTITLSGTYAFTIFKQTQFQDYEGSVTVGLFVRKAGVWSRVGALTASWYTNTDNPSSVNRVEIVPWTVTNTVQMGDSIEAFGATIESSSGPFAGRSVGLLSLGPIDWSSQGSASGTKSALASGAKTSIKITPQG